MNNKILKSAFFLILILFQNELPVEGVAPLPSSNHRSASRDQQTYFATFRHVPHKLKPIVNQMLKLPEANALLKKITQDGPINIVLENDPGSQFDAMWDGDSRTIRVNPNRHQDTGSWICSILFEMHNADTSSHMENLYVLAENNRTSKENWVEQMERMEHSNALKTCRLLEKGVLNGIYPKEARWKIFSNFDDYYKLQQITDHSHWLARAYDSVNYKSRHLPFQGTIPNLNRLSSEDKNDLQRYLVIKDNLENPDQQEAINSASLVKNEWVLLDECMRGERRDGCFRSKEKLRLMQIVFQDKQDQLADTLK